MNVDNEEWFSFPPDTYETEESTPVEVQLPGTSYMGQLRDIVERVLVSVDRDREYATPKPENGVVACLPFLDGFILDQVFACAICMVNLGMAGCFRI